MGAVTTSVSTVSASVSIVSRDVSRSVSTAALQKPSLIPEATMPHSTAQRGRRNLPVEVDVRLLELADDLAFARAASEALRNNSTLARF